MKTPKTRKSADCGRVRASLAEGQRGAVSKADEAHLFVCAGCRAEARYAAAWASFRALETDAGREFPAPADPAFVREVIELVRADRERRTRIRLRLAAAAALLFFFVVGASQRMTSTTAAGAEDTYAQLVSPDLDADLPE
jgi:hypothetical protein